ncbi:tRNA (adenosine(37)-N6)-threonylcarbamoyltransferase complex dimerization subunit type 1 TsaB [Aggregatilineales bacterium SYSU G02658]
MVLIAIDTATKALGLAFYDGKTLLAEQMWVASNQHNLLLAPAIQATLATLELAPQQLSAVAVANGPGSYTGLRIGIALAKGLAAARRIPLIGVSTLDILAVPQPVSTKFHLLCVVQAGRGRIIASQYVTRKGQWVVDTAPAITDWAALLPTLSVPTLITGEIDEEGSAQIAAQNNDSLVVVTPALRARRPGILAEEAWRRWQAHPDHDYSVNSVMPLYLQTP